MKIGYVTLDPLNIHNWSGSDYYIAKSLEHQGAELAYIDQLNVKKDTRFYWNKIKYRLARKTYMWDRDPHTATLAARSAAKYIKPEMDIIFAPTPIPIAYLETSKPKVFYHDATFAGLLNFYKPFARVSEKTLRHGHLLEQAALQSCSLALYTSDWAAQTAIDNYKVDPEKVKVVPFGANIEESPDINEVKALINKRSHQKCQLLFLGVDWERKGGALAVEVAHALNAAGLTTELHIVGIKDLPLNPMPSYVINHGFISKASEQGKSLIKQLIGASHFLILPSKAECYGLVFCEANAYGVPCVATNVGGIPTAVRNDINGKTFPLTAGANEYAAFIQSYFDHYHQYQQLALSSFNEYQTRLNWNTAGKTIMSLLQTL